MFREIAKKSGIYSLVPVINRGASFLLLPIYTRVLTPADYGVMELLDLTSNIVALLLGTRIGQALFYFYFAAANDEDRERCLGSLYTAATLVGALCACLMAAGSPLSNFVFGNPRFAGYLKLVLATFAVSIVGEVNLCYLRAVGKAARYVAATVVTLVLNVSISLILLLWFHLGVQGVLIAGLASSAVTAIWLGWTVLSPIRILVDWPLLVRIFRYSIPLSVSSLAMFLVHYGDRIFLRSQVSLAQLGVYALAYKFAMVVANCHLPFVLHWNAQVRSILQKPEGEVVYIRTCTYLTAGLALIGVGLSVLIRPVLAVMVGRGFAGAAPLVPLLVAAYVIRAVGAHIQSIFIAEGTPGIEARVSLVGAAVCIGAYAVLIPPFKLWGAVAATLLGFVTILGYGFYRAQRLRRFDFEYGRLLRIAVSASLTVGIFYSLPFQRWHIGTFAAAGFSLGYLLWILFGCLHAAERLELLSAAARVFRKPRLTQVETVA